MQFNRQNYDVLLKFIMIGDSNVGKDSILQNYCEETHTNEKIQIMGIDCRVKYENIENKYVKLMIWDTSGQERFRVLPSSFFKGQMGIIFTYSITDANSFKVISDWIKYIIERVDQKVTKIIIATKSDERDQRKVSQKEGEELAKRYGVKFFEVSAKEGTNISEAFQCITRQTLEVIDSHLSDKLNNNLKASKTSTNTTNNRC